jgi:hypothetical protein
MINNALICFVNFSERSVDGVATKGDMKFSNAKKNIFWLLSDVCFRNGGAITYGIKVGSTLQLWIVMPSTAVNP